MWNFELGKTFALLAKTMPFLLFRLAIYGGVALAYLFSVLIMGGIGYAIAGGGGALYGSLFGFGIVGAGVYFLREYLLYIVKAGHIAVLVELLNGRPLPDGKGQISYAKQMVQERFVQTSVLFGVDQLIKGVLRAINRLLFSISSFIPIPGLQSVVGFAQGIMNTALTYVDEIILAHCFETRAENAWAASKDGLILYAQNFKAFVRNAFFLVLLMWALSAVVFVIVFVPALAIAMMVPGPVAIAAVLLSLVFSWAIKAAVLEPIAVTAMMQVFFETTRGQVPNPEWDAKLSQISPRFRELKEKATNPPAPAAPPGFLPPVQPT